MITEPLWNLWDNPPFFPSLNQDTHTDVAIIGGGITGLTTALLLGTSGLKVTVLEAKQIGKGTTGHSTGNLYSITEDLFEKLSSKHDVATLKDVIGSRKEALNFIKTTIDNLQMDCDFSRQSIFLFEDETTDKIYKEQKAALEAELPVFEIAENTIPFSFKKGIQLNNQAQFNPLLYIQQLAAHLQTDGCNIFEKTRVNEINEDDDGYVLKTANARITAKYLVEATHTPKGVILDLHTALGPYREFGVAAKIEAGSFPEGIFWKYEKKEKYSIRKYSRNGEHFLIVLGKAYKVGQADDTKAKVAELIDFVKTHFQITELLYQWGGQNYKPADYLPYIGRLRDGSNHFVATGFSADGLVYGTLAAQIISETIQGREHPCEKLYKASRHSPLKAAQRVLKENVNVVGQYIKDIAIEDHDFRNLAPGQAEVIKAADKRTAAYRDTNGQLYLVSGICPHLGCTVHWNALEKSWDCPCHGSRYDIEGKIIEGPTLKDLKKISFDP